MGIINLHKNPEIKQVVCRISYFSQHMSFQMSMSKLDAFFNAILAFPSFIPDYGTYYTDTILQLHYRNAR